MPLPHRCLPSLALLALSVWGAAGEALAQDTRFGQPYAAGLHLNPALAGTSAVRSVTFSARDQYPRFGTEGFLTGSLVGDWRLAKLRGAVGVAIAYDRAGAAPVSRVQATAIYAYHTRLTSTWTASGAVGLGFGQLRGKLSSYVFADQLLLDGSIGPTGEISSFLPASYLTVVTGLVAYSKTAWVGVALHHANAPVLGSQTSAGHLPSRLTVHAGHKFFLLSALNLNRFYEFSATPVATFQWQGPARGLDIGTYLTYSPLTLGLLYRNPVLVSRATDQHWLVVSLGLAQRGWRMAYSYELGVGEATRGFVAHEVTLRLEELDYSGFLKKRTSRRSLPFIAAPVQ